MALRNVAQSIRNFFGPNNRFFNGVREDASAADPYYGQQGARQAAQQAPEAPYAQQQAPAGYYGQPQQQAAPYYGPQQQPPGYYAPQAQAQQPQPNPAYRTQAGYQQPMQQTAAPEFQQQTVNQAYVPPRNRRSAQHQAQPQMQPQQAENVVPFPAAAQQAAPAAEPQKKPAACVINVRNIADCRSAIGILRAGDCVIAVIDSIADQSEVRRYVDTLNGACFSLGCTMTRTSSRVGVYFLAPVGMQVLTDPTTTQMNSQSRAPQRARSGQGMFHAPFAARESYPQQAQQPAAYAQQPVYPQAPQYSPVQQPAYPAQPQAGYASQQPAQGYAPDQAGGDYAQDVVI